MKTKAKSTILTQMKPSYRQHGEAQDIWRIHTPNMLKEILSNPGTWALQKPLQIFGLILSDLGEIAARINDAELNKIMIRLSIYSCADPESPDYDPKLVHETLSK